MAYNRTLPVWQGECAPIDLRIPEFFHLDPEATTRMTAEEILTHLRACGGPVLTGSRKSQEIYLARVLFQLGVRRYRTSTWRGYIGIAPRSE